MVKPVTLTLVSFAVSRKAYARVSDAGCHSTGVQACMLKSALKTAG